MGRYTFIVALFLLLVCSCQKKDNTFPVVTIQGTNPHIVVFASDSAYADPGAVATDDMDGSLEVTSAGTVDMFAAGNYSITYTASDKSGNITEATRKVIVDAGPFLSGNFSVENFIGTTADSTYNDTISAPDTSTNVMFFKKFARIEQALVYATIGGVTLTIPSQTINCGNPAESKVFSGYGTFSNDTVFTIYYTVSNGATEYSGYGVYTRN
ncbi:MAG TPA: DUF5011 domain-containing protein [Bacteroidales bacterium]|nr:DUF5011 domain-containing protein [Bacteroidales bacterium]HPI29685.1 DUF5011 domain-containing protein [Bacteroidales bacterium]HQN15352.1 DUF5011 domain-containing protein [Bacteroidales bacterium]